MPTMPWMTEATRNLAGANGFCVKGNVGSSKAKSTNTKTTKRQALNEDV